MTDRSRPCAEGSKEIVAYNKRITEISKTITQLVGEYNSMLSVGARPGRRPADASLITSVAKQSGKSTFRMQAQGEAHAGALVGGDSPFPWVDEYDTGKRGTRLHCGLLDGQLVGW